MKRQWSIKPSCGTQLNRAHPLMRGLYYALPMNEGGGVNVANLAALGKPATFPATHVSWGNGGITLDGTNNAWPTIPADAALSTLTATLHIRLRANITGAQYLYGDNNAAGTALFYAMQLTAANKVSCNWNSSAASTSTAAIPVGIITDITVVRSGSSGSWTLLCYINGILDSTFSISTNPATCVSAQGIGGPGAYTGTGFTTNGTIYQFEIWNRDLSASEVQQMYMNPYCLMQPQRQLFTPDKLSGNPTTAGVGPKGVGFFWGGGD
jgi:hypothetical protein